MLWNDLVKVSLMGTDRNQLPATSLAKLEELGVDLNQDDAQVLLEGAGIYAMMRKSGQQFEQYDGPLPVADIGPEETICSEEAMVYLRGILYGDFDDTLPELIDHLVATQQKLPPEMLPELIDQAQNDLGTWTQLRPCIGQRGEWLLSCNPDWNHLIEYFDPEIWEMGKKAERLRFFQHLRQKDPTKARQLLLQTWSGESLKNKIAFLEYFSIGLSKRDEDFLEQCLDEGKKELRGMAAKYLAIIEGSAFSKRIKSRLQDLVHWKGKGTKTKVTLTLPENIDDAMIRDGIDPSVQWYSGGLKASRLGQMIALLSPTEWEMVSQLDASQCLHIFLQNDSVALLLPALLEAIVRHRNKDWMAAFLNQWLEKYDEPQWQKLSLTPLLDLLPNLLFNEIAIKSFKPLKTLPEENTPLDLLLKLEQQNWSGDLALLFVRNLQAWMVSEEASYWGAWNIRLILKNAAYRVHPLQFSKLNEGWPTETPVWGSWQKDVDGFLTTLRFRKEMLEHFRKEKV